MEETLLQKRFAELAERAYQGGRYAFTMFLSPAELDVFYRHARRLPPVPYTAWGGAAGCERQMLRFGDEALCGYDEPFPIACMEVRPRGRKFADALTHRDFLGALMNLGMEREVLGDIAVRENAAYVFCHARVVPVIEGELTAVKRTAVDCAVAEALPEGELYRLAPLTVQVSSPRADAVVAHAWKLSRGDSLELFRTGRVFINGRATENNSYALKENDLITVRGYGRMIYRGVQGVTRKGKSSVLLEKYE